MTDARRRAVLDAYASIDRSGTPLGFCSMCGTKVAPYALARFSADEFYERGSPAEPSASAL